MKIYLLLFLLIFALSCKTSSSNRHDNFRFVEVTYGNPGIKSTVYIDSTWSIIKCNYYNDSASCFIDTLDTVLKDSINDKIDKLKHFKIDSLYKGGCPDCGSYSVRIQYDNRISESLIIGMDKSKNRLFSLAFFISGIQINEHRLDSVIRFKTARKNRIKYNPPIL